MPFYIFGGSNSIFRDGWVAKFSELIGQPVHNRSVGATTTLSGIFRFLMPGEADQPREGDYVLWEYALNEVNHVSYGYRHEMILKNVEHFMTLCRDRGCKFIPIIMTPRWQENSVPRDPYYEKLMELFNNYGISPFDVSKEWRRSSGKIMPAFLYENNSHYARNPGLMNFIASGVANLIETSRIPNSIQSLYTAGRSVCLIEGLEKGFFKNSLMRVPTIPLPLSLELKGYGRIASILALCQADSETGVRVQLRPGLNESRQMRFSTTNINHKGVIVKSISLERALGRGWERNWSFSSSDRLRISPALLPGAFYAERELRSNLIAPNSQSSMNIAGVMVENF